MSENIIFEIHEDGYGVIKLNRPEKRNAINEEMITQLSSRLSEAKEAMIKFLVITGVGDKVFSAGGDLNYLHGELDSSEAFSRLYAMKEVLFEIVSFPVPTICLLNGDAYGGGCEIATACDFRVAKPSTKFGFIQSNLGILPGWGGGVLLYEKVNPNFAYQWLVSGEVYQADYLLTQGWLHQVVNEDQFDKEKILTPYVKKTYEQMEFFKRQFNNKLSVLALAAQMSEEVRNCSTLWGTEAQNEVVNRIVNK